MFNVYVFTVYVFNVYVFNVYVFNQRPPREGDERSSAVQKPFEAKVLSKIMK